MKSAAIISDVVSHYDHLYQSSCQSSVRPSVRPSVRRRSHANAAIFAVAPPAARAAAESPPFHIYRTIPSFSLEETIIIISSRNRRVIAELRYLPALS